MSTDENIVNAAADVTSALRRTHQLMQSELSRSAFAAETLDSSSRTLQSLQNEYTVFGALLAGSRRLIQELERADKWDRWAILASLALFVSTFLWIVYRRILRPVVSVGVWALGAGRKKETAAVGEAAVQSAVLASTLALSVAQSISSVVQSVTAATSAAASGTNVDSITVPTLADEISALADEGRSAASDHWPDLNSSTLEELVEETPVITRDEL